MVEKDTPGMSFGAKEKKVEFYTSSCVLVANSSIIRNIEADVC